MAQLPRLQARWLPAAPPAIRDVRAADRSADGRRSAAIFATVELPSAGGGHIVSPPPGDTLLESYFVDSSSNCYGMTWPREWRDRFQTGSGTGLKFEINGSGNGKGE